MVYALVVDFVKVLLEKIKIEVSMSPKGRLEPKEISKISPEVFNKILNICPGTIVEGLPKEEVTSDAKLRKKYENKIRK